MYSGNYFPSVQPTPQKQTTNVYQAMQLVGHQVKVNRGGPDSVEGTLLAIPGDFLVVAAKDVTVYVNGAHVKSITEGSSTGGKSDGKSGGKSGGSTSGRSRSQQFISASSFNSLLSRLRHQFIQINRGGPEKVEGFLAETNSNFLLLIVQRELVRIPIFHIKTFNISGKSQSGGNKNNDKSNNKNNDKSNNKSNGKSNGKSNSNNKSGNKKSGEKSGNKNRTGGRNRNNGRRQ
jgi:spore coat protein B